MCTCDFHYGCYSTIFKNIFLKFIKNKELAYIYNFYIKMLAVNILRSKLESMPQRFK